MRPKNKGKVERKVTFHRIPGNDKKELRKKWLVAIGHLIESVLTKCTSTESVAGRIKAKA